MKLIGIIPSEDNDRIGLFIHENKVCIRNYDADELLMNVDPSEIIPLINLLQKSHDIINENKKEWDVNEK